MPRDTAVKFCCWNKLKHSRLIHGPLARYVKLRVTHAPGMPGTFSPPPTSKETAILRSRHASRHVRHARAVMHVGIVNPRRRGKRSRIPGGCAIRNFTYLARGPYNYNFLISLSPFPIIHQILRLIRIHYYEIKWPLTKTTKHKIPLIEVSIAFSYEYIFSYMCSSTKQSMHYG